MLDKLYIGMEVAQFFTDRDKTASILHKKLSQYTDSLTAETLVSCSVVDSKLKSITKNVLSKSEPATLKLVRLDTSVVLAEDGVRTTVFVSLDRTSASLSLINNGTGVLQ